MAFENVAQARMEINRYICCVSGVVLLAKPEPVTVVKGGG
jgi:hypothetical protein